MHLLVTVMNDLVKMHGIKSGKRNMLAGIMLLGTPSRLKYNIKYV